MFSQRLIVYYTPIIKATIMDLEGIMLSEISQTEGKQNLLTETESRKVEKWLPKTGRG